MKLFFFAGYTQNRTRNYTINKPNSTTLITQHKHLFSSIHTNAEVCTNHKLTQKKKKAWILGCEQAIGDLKTRK